MNVRPDPDPARRAPFLLHVEGVVDSARPLAAVAVVAIGAPLLQDGLGSGSCPVGNSGSVLKVAWHRVEVPHCVQMYLREDKTQGYSLTVTPVTVTVCLQ